MSQGLLMCDAEERVVIAIYDALIEEATTALT